MGRLTLNVLLSFAQFEREVTGERIRDKIAASKKKGMWMGGPVPIGYRVEDRQLLLEPTEAATVRMIFERYVELRSVPQLVEEMANRGVRTRRREYRDGKVRGDIPFTKGPLASALKNPIYTGKIRHGELVYDGQHEAIITQQLWDQAQAVLQANGQDRLLGKKAKNPSFLAGRLVDPDGSPMTPVHTTKKARLYRYYITRFKAGEDTGQPWRVPAGDLDRFAACLVVEWRSATSMTADIGKLEAQAGLAGRFKHLTVAEQRGILIEHALVFALHEDSITLSSSKIGGSQVCAKLPPRLVTHGQDRKLAIPPYGQAAKEADPVLVKLLAHAQSAHRMVLEGSVEPSVAHFGKRHLWQLLRIGWLAPNIVSAIVDGQQPIGLTGRRLLRAANLPLGWAEQRAFLGFA